MGRKDCAIGGWRRIGAPRGLRRIWGIHTHNVDSRTTVRSWSMRSACAFCPLPVACHLCRRRSDDDVAELQGRRLHHQGFPLRERRDAARAALALPHARHGEAQCGRRDHQRRGAAARHQRRGQFVDAALARRRAVQGGPAARCGRALHHHPGRHRRRRLVETERWTAREVPALSLCRYASGPSTS